MNSLIRNQGFTKFQCDCDNHVSSMERTRKLTLRKNQDLLNKKFFLHKYNRFLLYVSKKKKLKTK